jgi:hypothetical protein
VGADIDSGVDLVVEVAGRGHDDVRHLVADVVATLGRPPGRDDVTVLAVRRAPLRAPVPRQEPDTPPLRCLDRQPHLPARLEPEFRECARG